MLYPSCVIISHVGPSYWLPFCEVWTLLDLRFMKSSNPLLEGHLGNPDLLLIHRHQLPHGEEWTFCATALGVRG